MSQKKSVLADVFPATLAVIGTSVANDVMARSSLAGFSDALASLLPDLLPSAPGWVVHLAELERAVDEAREWARENAFPTARDVGIATINSGLQILESPWRGIASLHRRLVDGIREYPEPESGEELLLVWPVRSGEVSVRVASSDDLLALKMADEGLSPADVSAETGAPIAGVTRLLVGAGMEDMIFLPQTKISRPERAFSARDEGEPDIPESVFNSQAFVLQWHITQRCDLNCRHCYDRSQRADVTLEDGYQLLEQMARFCADRRVAGQVSFSGGNPLLHPDFFRFYERAADLGLNLAILGNPCSAEALDRMCAIDPPVYYQISLEGLEEHNNHIRGQGHFERALAFLELLKARGIHSQVMLTLTADNQGQVVPLGELLEGKTDSFTYNRLAPVGEGAALACAPTEGYSEFLRRYLDVARRHSHVGLKDSLFNLILQENDAPCFGGCTGSGCGAAFNFLSVLGDGTVHACRKMDSPVGNIHDSGLEDVYDGDEALRYRAGCTACIECGLRPACGGCMAVAKGMGLDPFVERDPYCPL